MTDLIRCDPSDPCGLDLPCPHHKEAMANFIALCARILKSKVVEAKTVEGGIAVTFEREVAN